MQEARADPEDEDGVKVDKVPQSKTVCDGEREKERTATAGSLASPGRLASPAAWLSGLVPGGPNDMTTAVASAATWVRQRDVEAQKAEMQRKIEEALAEEALKEEKAAVELAARRQREAEALGDADDVASRILRRRAAASRARLAPKQLLQDTSVVHSSALRSTGLVVPVESADEHGGATARR